MTAEYSGDPATSTKDEVRFLVGDTDTTAFLFQDEEIDYLVTAEGSATRAAIRGAEVLATKFASLVDKAVGDLKVSYSQRSSAFRDMATHLRQATRLAANPKPVLTGSSISAKQDAITNYDRVPNNFIIGQDDWSPPKSGRDDPRWMQSGSL